MDIEAKPKKGEKKKPDPELWIKFLEKFKLTKPKDVILSFIQKDLEIIPNCKK